MCIFNRKLVHYSRTCRQLLDSQQRTKTKLSPTHRGRWSSQHRLPGWMVCPSFFVPVNYWRIVGLMLCASTDDDQVCRLLPLSAWAIVSNLFYRPVPRSMRSSPKWRWSCAAWIETPSPKPVLKVVNTPCSKRSCAWSYWRCARKMLECRLKARWQTLTKWEESYQHQNLTGIEDMPAQDQRANFYYVSWGVSLPHIEQASENLKNFS